MAPLESIDITGLLKAWRHGDQRALEELMPLVYAQLHAQARRQMRNEQSGATLQSTALVHEVYLRLVRAHDVDWHDRTHFFALSADHAAHPRRRGPCGSGVETRWRGGTRRALICHRFGSSSNSRFRGRLIALRTRRCTRATDADRSAAREGCRAAILRRPDVEETADFLRVSSQTVMRDWRLARAWLARELNRGQ